MQWSVQIWRLQVLFESVCCPRLSQAPLLPTVYHCLHSEPSPVSSSRSGLALESVMHATELSVVAFFKKLPSLEWVAILGLCACSPQTCSASCKEPLVDNGCSASSSHSDLAQACCDGYVSMACLANSVSCISGKNTCDLNHSQTRRMARLF